LETYRPKGQRQRLKNPFIYKFLGEVASSEAIPKVKPLSPARCALAYQPKAYVFIGLASTY